MTGSSQPKSSGQILWITVGCMAGVSHRVLGVVAMGPSVRIEDYLGETGST